MHDSMDGQKMEQPWARTTWTVWVGVFAIPSVVAVYSALAPTQFAASVHVLCASVPNVCIPQSHFDDLGVLTKMGFAHYAVGFVALRQLGGLIAALAFLTLAVFTALTRSYEAGSPLGLRQFALGNLMFAGVGWWAFAAPDFYFAGGGFFSGAMRPPIGSVIYVWTPVMFSVGVLVTIIWFVKFITKSR